MEEKLQEIAVALEGAPDWVKYSIMAIGMVVIVANAWTMSTPSTVDDTFWGKYKPYVQGFQNVINMLALNIYGNTNADKKTDTE